MQVGVRVQRYSFESFHWLSTAQSPRDRLAFNLREHSHFSARA
jgi:hypothetical protein